MCDSLLNPIITELAKVLLEKDVSIYWDGYLRVDKASCDIDNVFQWRRGGFYRARLGVESGSQKILDAMHKEITIEQIKEAIINLSYAGIKTTTYWIIGYPGETEEDFQQTLDLIEELKDEIYEADCNGFIYFLTGQAHSKEWVDQYKSISLYPDKVKNMLMLNTWILDCEPSREETFKRVNRFVQHCKRLGIPNPYSLHDVYLADERWTHLHENAVPPLVQFEMNGPCIDERKKVKNLLRGQNPIQDPGSFCF
jgi:radical SAM superfamily enzyme YgiQ (UPF0313 family)